MFFKDTLHTMMTYAKLLVYLIITLLVQKYKFLSKSLVFAIFVDATEEL